MKNAIRFGLLLGIISGIWIMIMHIAGVYERQYPQSDDFSFMEMISIVIPFIALFLGIKNFRDNINGGKMEFFEGIFEGIKIMVVGGFIAAFFATIYISYVNPDVRIDFMARVGGAGIIGILFTLVISLLLMNKQRNL